MKTLLVSIAADGTDLHLRQVPDSALLAGGRPVFLPDYADDTRLAIMPAVRISRLGLAISSRFARRYYDAATLVALNAPGRPDRTTELNLVADNALIVGTWTDIPATDTWTADIAGHSAHSFHIADRFERIIEAVSRCSTMKTGDIIAIDDPSLCIDAALNDTIDARLNGIPILHFRIK